VGLSICQRGLLGRGLLEEGTSAASATYLHLPCALCAFAHCLEH